MPWLRCWAPGVCRWTSRPPVARCRRAPDDVRLPVDAPTSAPGRKIQHSPMLGTGFWSATHTQAPATRQERRQLRRLRMRRKQRAESRKPRAATAPEAESKASVIIRAGRDAARRDSPVRACGGSAQPGREIPRERVRRAVHRRTLLTRPGGKAISRLFRLADAQYTVRLATVSAPGTAGGAEFQSAGLFGARCCGRDAVPAGRAEPCGRWCVRGRAIRWERRGRAPRGSVIARPADAGTAYAGRPCGELSQSGKAGAVRRRSSTRRCAVEPDGTRSAPTSAPGSPGPRRLRQVRRADIAHAKIPP